MELRYWTYAAIGACLTVAVGSPPAAGQAARLLQPDARIAWSGTVADSNGCLETPVTTGGSSSDGYCEAPLTSTDCLGTKLGACSCAATLRISKAPSASYPPLGVGEGEETVSPECHTVTFQDRCTPAAYNPLTALPGQAAMVTTRTVGTLCYDPGSEVRTGTVHGTAGRSPDGSTNNHVTGELTIIPGAAGAVVVFVTYETMCQGDIDQC